MNHDRGTDRDNRSNVRLARDDGESDVERPGVACLDSRKYQSSPDFYKVWQWNARVIG